MMTKQKRQTCKIKTNLAKLLDPLSIKRLGFQFEGIARQAYVFKGHNRDTAWYSIIDSEWPALKAKFLKWLLPDNFDANGQQLLKLQEIY